MLVINDFIYQRAESIGELEVNLIRVVQVGIVVGMLLLYSHMLKSRKRYYASLSEPKQESVKSPQRSSKRD